MQNIPSIIAEMKARPNSHWQAGKNTDTDSQGYFIEHAGSLWAGQANTQNTLEELFKVLQEYGPENVTITKGNGLHIFSGNCQRLSNSFHVWIWSEKVARQVRRFLKELSQN